jgi:hypothetical protein
MTGWNSRLGRARGNVTVGFTGTYTSSDAPPTAVACT